RWLTCHRSSSKGEIERREDQQETVGHLGGVCILPHDLTRRIHIPSPSCSGERKIEWDGITAVRKISAAAAGRGVCEEASYKAGIGKQTVAHGHSHVQLAPVAVAVQEAVHARA